MGVFCIPRHGMRTDTKRTSIVPDFTDTAVVACYRGSDGPDTDRTICRVLVDICRGGYGRFLIVGDENIIAAMVGIDGPIDGLCCSPGYKSISYRQGGSGKR